MALAGYFLQSSQQSHEGDPVIINIFHLSSAGPDQGEEPGVEKLKAIGVES